MLEYVVTLWASFFCENNVHFFRNAQEEIEKLKRKNSELLQEYQKQKADNIKIHKVKLGLFTKILRLYHYRFYIM